MEDTVIIISIIMMLNVSTSGPSREYWDQDEVEVTCHVVCVGPIFSSQSRISFNGKPRGKKISHYVFIYLYIYYYSYLHAY